MKTEEVIVIGGGPAGLSAAIYLARANLKPLMIGGFPFGGQLMLTSYVENYPGFDSILGGELILKMKKQAEKFGARIIEKNVTKVSFSKKPFLISVGLKKKVYQTKTVLIATGAEVRWLGLPSEQRLRGKGVSACALCDGFFFRDKVVAVVGGGDTAIEEALTLTKFAKKVYIIHRRSEFRASKIMQKRVFENSKIEVIWDAVVEEILGEQRVEGIKIKIQNPKSKIQNLKLDGVFIAVGHRPATEFLKNSGIILNEKGYIITRARAALENAKDQNYNFIFQFITSVPGVFAAGDVIDPDFRQAATAVGTGVAAALEIERFLIF